MIEWRELGDFATVQKAKNKNHVTEDAYSITQGGLVPTRSFFKEKTNVTSSDTSGYYIVQKDWFVYSPSRIDVGSISYLKDKGPVIVSPIDVVFSIDTKVCMPEFLLNYLLSHDGMNKVLRHREGVEGTGRRNLPFKAIQHILIPVPSISEQKRIVDILDTFTASIENLKEQIAQRRKQYEYYRDQLLDLEGREDVEMKMLGKVCDIKGRIGFRGYTREDQVAKGVGAISLSPGNITNGIINFDSCTYITWAKYEESPEIMIYKGDIILCKTASVGKVAIITSLPEKATLNPQLVVLKEIKVNNKYLFHLLSSYKYQSIFSHLAGVGSVPNISQAKLNNIKIPVPSLQEQVRIVAILDTFEESIANLEAQLKEREKQYEYYRNKLLTFE